VLPRTPHGSPHKVPDSLRRRIEEYADSWLSSELVERGFNVLRKASQASDNAALSRQHRWSQLVRSDLMKDHGQKELHVTNAARTAGLGKKCSPEMFQATSDDTLSLPEPHFAKIMECGQEYPSFTAENYHLTALRWAAFLEDPSAATIKNRWFNLLLRPGHVIINKAQKTFQLVFFSCAQFALVRTTRAMVQSDAQCCRYISLDEAAQKEFTVFNLPSVSDPWFVSETTGIPPYKSLEYKLGCQMTFKVSKNVLTVPSGAARCGFKGMTVAYLERLFNLLGVEGRRPAGEAKLVEALLRHLIPSLDDEMLKHLLAIRNATDTTAVASVLQEEGNLDIAMEAVPEDDAAVFAKAASAKKHGIIGLDEVGPDGEEPAPGAAASSSSAEKREPTPSSVPLASSGLSLAFVRSLLPDQSGCNIYAEETWYTRWKVNYPTDTPPHMHTVQWGEDLSVVAALRVALEWVWGHHFRKTGAKCPFEIERLPDLVLHGGVAIEPEA
jgi:hypothetical protein